MYNIFRDYCQDRYAGLRSPNEEKNKTDGQTFWDKLFKNIVANSDITSSVAYAG